jgi:hypothetical protein
VQVSILNKVRKEIVHEAPKPVKGKVNIGKGTDVEKVKVIPLTKETFPEGTDFREFRAAIVCSLPFINPDAKDSYKEQLSGQDLILRTQSALTFWKKNVELADSISLAYAVKVALGRNSKATPEHFDNARNKLINNTANVAFTDANGKIYHRYSDLPVNVRQFFESTYQHKTKVDAASSVLHTKEDITPEPKKVKEITPEVSFTPEVEIPATSKEEEAEQVSDYDDDADRKEIHERMNLYTSSGVLDHELEGMIDTFALMARVSNMVANFSSLPHADQSLILAKERKRVEAFFLSGEKGW